MRHHVLCPSAQQQPAKIDPEGTAYLGDLNVIVDQRVDCQLAATARLATIKRASDVHGAVDMFQVNSLTQPVFILSSVKGKILPGCLPEKVDQKEQTKDFIT